MKTVLFVILSSVALSFIPNKSNFPDELVIPLIVSLFTKYTLGDWDKGYQWTQSDIYYWLTLLGVSFITVKIVKMTPKS